MAETDLSGKVQTVLGVIDTESLGITLYHEHLLVDMTTFFFESNDPLGKEMAYQPVKLDNLHWIRANRINNLDNLKINDEQLIIKEASMFKQAGGNSIVEVSNIGMSRNPEGLARISRETGLNVIMGSGYYVGMSHPADMKTRSEEEITEEIVKDITEGVEGTEVRAGVIGEIGCSLPLNDGEKKVLRASGAAQYLTGAALIIHPCPDDTQTLNIIEILDKAGADLSRTIISHVDIMGFKNSTRSELLNAGCYIGYDCFGHLGFPHMMHEQLIELKGDLERVCEIMEVIEKGYLDRIMIAQDHCFKDCLTTYGGYGYAHILKNVLTLMHTKGITESQINTIMVENPKRFFQFVAPKK